MTEGENQTIDVNGGGAQAIITLPCMYIPVIHSYENILVVI